MNGRTSPASARCRRPRDADRHARSTRRWSSKPRPAPARPPSSSAGSSGSSPKDAPRSTRSSRSPSPRKPRASSSCGCASGSIASGPRSRATEARGLLDAALTRLEEAHISTIHGFCAELLRERPVEARIDPLFEVLTEPAAARLFDDAFGRWLQEQLADPPEGVRRALRRTAFGGDDGPIDRLRNAAWELTGWRDFTGDWTRNPFEREREIADTVALLHEVAALTRDPSSRNDPLCTSTEPVRRLSDEIGLQQQFGDAGTPDYDGWEAGLVDLSRDRVLGNVRHGRGALYKNGVRRDERARTRSSSCDRASISSAWTPTPISRRCCSASCAARRRDTRAEGRGGRARLPRSAGARARPRARQPDGAARLPAALHPHLRRRVPGHRPAAGRDPAAARRRQRGRDRLAEGPAGSRPPLPGRRPEAVDLPVPPRRRRHLPRGVGAARRTRRAAAAAQHQLPQRARDPGLRERRVRAGDDRRRGHAAGAVRAAGSRPPALPNQPAIVVLPVPSPYATRYVSGAAIDKSLPAAVGAMVDWILNQSGWKVTERSGTAPVARRGEARVPALPPLRQLADRCDPALRRGARGARHSSRAGRRTRVSRARGDRSDPRRARRGRVARRRAVGVRDAARPVLRDHGRGPARLGLPVPPHRPRRASGGTRSIPIGFPRSSPATRRPTSSTCARSPARCSC